MSTGEFEGRVALVTGAHESGSLTTPEQSASALLEHLRTGGSGQIWDVA